MISINAETLKTMKEIDGSLGVFGFFENDNKLIFRKVRERVLELCPRLEYVTRFNDNEGAFRASGGPSNKTLHTFRIKGLNICDRDVFLRFYRNKNSIFTEAGSNISSLPSIKDDASGIDASANAIIALFNKFF